MERNITYECCQSVSQCYMRIWMQSEMMCDYVSFSIKKGYWKGCPIRSERLYTNYCEVQGWKNFVFVSITKHPFDKHEMKYRYENICAHLKLKGTFHSVTQFGSRFLKKYHKVHISLPWCMHAQKVSIRHTENSLSLLNFYYGEWWFLLI